MKQIISIALIILITLGQVLSAAPTTGTATGGNILSYYDNAPELVKSTVKSFSDVKETDWYIKDLSVLQSYGVKAKRNIINGYKGLFNPKKDVSKAEFVKMLVEAMQYKLVDGSTFKDINYDTYWARKYIETAVKEGVIVPSEWGEQFWGDVPLKRADMAMMMVRALKLQPSDGENPFADVEGDGYVVRLREEYLIKGFRADNGQMLFKVNAYTSKAEAATVIVRMIQYGQDRPGYMLRMRAEENGVAVRLYMNGKNLDGRSMGEAHGDLIKVLSINDNSMRDYNLTPEQAGKKMVQMARDFVMADWNIDYRTVEETYSNKVKDIVPYDYYMQVVPRVIRNYIDNKVIEEAKFYTADDLVYFSDGVFYVRGTVKFRFLKPTSEKFLSKLQEKDNGKNLKLGQWYEEDVEIELAGDVADSRGMFKVFSVRILEHARPIAQ